MEQVSSLQDELIKDIHITQFEVYDESYFIVYDVFISNKLYVIETKIDRKEGWFEIIEDNGLKDQLINLTGKSKLDELEAEALINNTTREALKQIKI